MLKGSCLINHEKVYIIYVDSLYKICATYGGNRQGNEQVASFLAPLGEEPGASRDLALWPI